MLERGCISDNYCRWFYKMHRRVCSSRLKLSSRARSGTIPRKRRILHGQTSSLVGFGFLDDCCGDLTLCLESNKPRSGTEIREKESISRIFDRDHEGLGSIMKKQETWYPTVRKMVWVLEQLHDFVKVGSIYPRPSTRLKAPPVSLPFSKTSLRKLPFFADIHSSP